VERRTRNENKTNFFFLRGCQFKRNVFSLPVLSLTPRLEETGRDIRSLANMYTDYSVYHASKITYGGVEV
jgi:hypothetical protein